MDIQKINFCLNSGDLLDDTVKQLEKDFLIIDVGFDIERPVKNYKHLFDCTLNLINDLNDKDPQSILNLLYRVDLSEEFVRSEMQKTELSFVEMISDIIVKRELYKVILRTNED